MCKFILHVLKYFIKNYCCKNKDKKCHMKSHLVPLKIVLYTCRKHAFSLTFHVLTEYVDIRSYYFSSF
jgi:hypothetical protein